MSFFRQDALASLNRWKGVGLAGAVAVCGVLVLERGIRTGDLFQAGIGGVLAVASVMAGFAMVQRERLRWHGEHFGAVEVDEREIRAFGPEGQTILSLDMLDRIEVRGSEGLGSCWVLHRSGTGLMPVIVPVTADGNGGLFDAISSLPGIDLSKLVDVSVRPPERTVLIWKRKRASRSRA